MSINQMIYSSVSCTRCGSKGVGTCDCWVRCPCGCTKGKGELCSNPNCEFSKAPSVKKAKARPLSAIALSDLKALIDHPIPKQEFNPGVVNKLTTEKLVEIVDLPSPYKTHHGKKCAHLRITAVGLLLLAENQT